jgi:hypothetical protein
MMKRKKANNDKAAAMNAAFYGPEPSYPYDHNLNRIEYIQALNWYAATLTREDSKDYVTSFLRDQKNKTFLKKVQKVPHTYFTPTYGAIARMMSNDLLIPDSGAKWLDRNLNALIEQHTVDDPVVTKVAKAPVNIQSRIQSRAYQVANEIDDLFEDNVWFNTNKLEPNAVYNLLHSKCVSGLVAQKVAATLTPHLEELKSIKSDPQLKEAYRKYSRRDIARFIDFYQNAVDTCENYSGNEKKMKVRKPRAKKVVTADKQLANFKYMKLYNEYQIASVNPSKVLGANQVWLYKPKYQHLTVLNALDRAGLNIKGQTFKNVDLKNSMRIVIPRRRVEEIVKAISVGGKRAVTNIFNDINRTAYAPKLKVNDGILILAVF